MTRDAATRDSWRTTPMPAARVSLPFPLRLTSGEFERLRRGFIPDCMEDRWFVFHEDGWVHFHRSWTGYCIYQIRFEPEGGDVVAREAWASRDPQQYGNPELAEDAQMLRSILRNRFGIEDRQRNG